MTTNLVYTRYQSPMGKMVLVAGEAGVCKIALPVEDEATALNWVRKTFSSTATLEQTEGYQSSPYLLEIGQQLEAYFNGTLRNFVVKMDMRGTEFQRKVWEAVAAIPYAATSSYKNVAVTVGNIKAVRAVGAANGANPLPIIVPCHRVIGTNGSLVGYGGGIEFKQRLLALEGISLGI